MAGFKKLILIQILSWLACVAVGSYFIAISFNYTVNEAQKNAQATVQNYIDGLTLSDISTNNFKRAITNNDTFANFILRDNQGAEVSKVTHFPGLALLPNLSKQI